MKRKLPAGSFCFPDYDPHQGLSCINGHGAGRFQQELVSAVTYTGSPVIEEPQGREEYKKTDGRILPYAQYRRSLTQMSASGIYGKDRNGVPVRDMAS